MLLSPHRTVVCCVRGGVCCVLVFVVVGQLCVALVLMGQLCVVFVVAGQLYACLQLQTAAAHLFSCLARHVLAC